ncbi:hypothetical protein B9Z55_023001 [Caenorhabditis nigoni]|nr:hypothetical protein B9Z55_023001 [Caenorhabditis nigoni]
MSQQLKRKGIDGDNEKPIEQFLLSKRSRTNDPTGLAIGTLAPAAKALNREDAFVLRIKPLHLEMPTAHFDHDDLNERLDKYSSNNSGRNDFRGNDFRGNDFRGNDFRSGRNTGIYGANHYERNSFGNNHYGSGSNHYSGSSSSSSSSRNKKPDMILDGYGNRPIYLLQNLSVFDDESEFRKYFNLLDLKSDETSKCAAEARRRLRMTNVHHLICPQEKMFLTTACDYFGADYDDLMDYIESVGESRDKQIIVDHSYYKLFMHTLKMFYYTDKGWRFHLEFDEFFCGHLRKYREPIIEQMTTNYNNAKKAAQEHREKMAARRAALEIAIADIPEIEEIS